MARARTGWIGQDEDGRWFYRYQYTDEFGRRRNVRRLATSESNAKSKLRKALNKHETGGKRSIEGERLKFSELSKEYARRHIIEAEYQGERKIAGLRSLRSAEMFLETLKAHFGDKRVTTIAHSDVEDFKLKRLRTKKANDESRSIASVNRELALLRAMMRFAKRQKWILNSPFEEGAPLISAADETKRERVLTHEEERRLLASCGERIVTYKCRRGKKIVEIQAHDKGEKREHLRALIIAALDTAMRRGELFKLKWSDIDFKNEKITIRAMNSKTARARIVGITPRLHEELTKLWQNSPKQIDLGVFGYDEESGSIKTAWGSLCTYAKIDDFRFHDCRHTAITRMVASGMPTAQIMKISGHTQMTTFQRYVNPTDDAVKQVAMHLHEHNTHQSAQQITSELVN
jgi:integrase